ncbi:MAG: hypothetical protein KKC76_16450 [Proteobacteria bacterium]|nr:hypothetical protein [Pseudomonadota bacterium]MBU4297733.1 hypothetical protein [Pseudomonadota bacterium]MCG2749610.1 hypothetical protein [Desulfobulbaceae bacterium]
MNRQYLTNLATFFFAIILLLLPPSSARGLEHQWSKRFGDVSDQTCLGMATDHDGNVIIIGSFAGVVDFGGGLLTSAGGRDIFLAKFDGAGNHLWSRRFGDKYDQTGYGVAVDSNGQIVLTGSFSGKTDFGGGLLTSAGGQDIFLARFSAAGSHLWSMGFGDSADQVGNSVAIDSAGNIIVIGELSGAADFGGGSISSAGGRDIFLVRFGPAGAYHWSMCFGDSADQSSRHVAIDGSNNILITGTFAGAVDFGGGTFFSNGDQDMFLASFSTFGIHRWSRGFGGKLDQAGQAIAIDDAGDVVVTGSFAGKIDFGGGLLTSSGGQDIFLARFDALGNHLWSMGIGDAADQSGASVAVNFSGNIVTTGYFEGWVDFGGGPLASSGLRDVFLAVFEPSGAHLLSQAFGDADDQQGTAVVTSASGDVLAAGDFAGSVNFGGGTLTSAGGSDIYLVDFGCPGDFDHDSDVDGVDLFLLIDKYYGIMTTEEFAANFGRLGCP